MALQKRINERNFPPSRPTIGLGSQPFGEGMNGEPALSERPFGRGMNGEPALSERPFGMSMNGEVDQTALGNSYGFKPDGLIANSDGVKPVGQGPMLPRPKLGASDAMLNDRLRTTSGRMTGRLRNKFADGPYRGRTPQSVESQLNEEADAMNSFM